MELKKQVKKGLLKQFKKLCQNNSMDSYSCAITFTVLLVLENLTQHIDSKFPLLSPQEAWDAASKCCHYHSGASASFVAMIIIKYSVRGDEFKEWAKQSGQFMIKWENEKNEKIN